MIDPLQLSLLELLRSNKFEEAVITVRASVIKAPQKYFLYQYLGAAYIGLNLDKKAEAVLRRNIGALGPPTAEAAYYLGLALMRQRIFWEAEKWFGYALTSRPDWANALRNRFNCLVWTKQFGEAVLLTQRWVEIRPAEQESLLALGEAQFQNGQSEQAVKTLKRATLIKPNEPKNLIPLCRSSLDCQDGTMANDCVSKYSILESKDNVWRELAGLTAEHKRDWTRAEFLLHRTNDRHLRNYLVRPDRFEKEVLHQDGCSENLVDMYAENIAEPFDYVLMTSADGTYLERFGKAYATYVAESPTKRALVHFHAIDAEYPQLRELEKKLTSLGIKNFAISKEQSQTVSPQDKRSYYACARLIQFSWILRHYEKAVIVTDIDAVLTANIDHWIGKQDGGGLSVVLRSPVIHPALNQICCLMLAYPDPPTFEFLNLVRKFLLRIFAIPGQSEWLLDQLSLHCCNQYAKSTLKHEGIKPVILNDNFNFIGHRHLYRLKKLDPKGHFQKLDVPNV